MFRAMVRAVQPPIGAKELWMLTGVADESGFGVQGRLAAIDEDMEKLHEGGDASAADAD